MQITPPFLLFLGSDKGSLFNPAIAGVRLGGITLNSRMITQQESAEQCAQRTRKFGVPCFEPLIDGTKEFVNAL